MDSVVHFEMPATDRARVKKFYESAFGWTMTQYGPEMGNYVMAVTGPTDEQGMVQKSGFINGGFFPTAPENAHPSVVINVSDIKAAMKKVQDAGGKIVESTLMNGEPMNIPSIGLYVGFIDTEGNRVSLLQPAAGM